MMKDFDLASTYLSDKLPADGVSTPQYSAGMSQETSIQVLRRFQIVAVGHLGLIASISSPPLSLGRLKGTLGSPKKQTRVIDHEVR